MNLQEEFPQDKNLLYLNHAAVSPWPIRTANSLVDFAKENIHVGASHYHRWTATEALLRRQLKDLINAPSTNSIALLKNTSEGISVVAEGIRWQSGDNVVSTNQEFPSNRIPWQAQEKHGVEFREVELTNGPSPEQNLIDACDRNTRILTISSVQYGTGLKINLEQLGQFCNKHNILFCVDAIQSIGAHVLDVQQCQIDFAMADAHKWMMGPEGIALFYCRDNLIEQLELHQYGWHMIKSSGNYDLREWRPASNAKRFECGSPNMLGIHALSASLSIFEDYGIDKVERDINERVNILFEAFRRNKRCQLITPIQRNRRAGIVTVRLTQHEAADIHRQFIQNQLICAYRYGGIRFSPHFYTSADIIERSIAMFNKALDS